MKSESYVFEVIDATDDEMYYPLGVFLSQKEAVAAIKKSEDEDNPISMWAGMSDSDNETIKVRKRKVGWSEGGDCVLTINRKIHYDEENDKYVWRRV